MGAREERGREVEGWRSRKRKVWTEVNMSIKEGWRRGRSWTVEWGEMRVQKGQHMSILERQRERGGVKKRSKL